MSHWRQSNETIQQTYRFSEFTMQMNVTLYKSFHLSITVDVNVEHFPNMYNSLCTAKLIFLQMYTFGLATKGKPRAK